MIKLKGMIIKGKQERPGSGTLLLARQDKKLIRCVRCKGKDIRKKSKIVRQVKHMKILSQTYWIQWEGHKYYCRTCTRYFNEQFPGLQPRRQYTETFRKEIINQHHHGISQTSLKQLKGVGTATIERWYHDLLKLKKKEYNQVTCPKQLGIDEHRFSKKMGFATTLCDLSKHRILDLLPGRSESAILAKLKKLPGRLDVEMVNIDLSETYRSLAKKAFPNAVIVTDRFHVIRLINQHFLATWHTLDPSAKHNRGLLSLIRRHEHNLSPEQQHRLTQYLHSIPGLKAIYDMKQSLCKLLSKKHQTAKQCRRHIPSLLRFIDDLKRSHFPSLVTLGHTLASWDQEVAAMWRFTKTNSITEGFHRKMKFIQRKAYGFKNFDNYRLRVKVLCANETFILT